MLIKFEIGIEENTKELESINILLNKYYSTSIRQPFDGRSTIQRSSKVTVT